MAVDKTPARATALASYRSSRFGVRRSGGGTSASTADGRGDGDAAVAMANFNAHGVDEKSSDDFVLPPGWSSTWSAEAQATYFTDPAGRSSWVPPSAQANSAANVDDAAGANDDAAEADGEVRRYNSAD